MMGLFQASNPLLPDTFSCCFRLRASAHHPTFCLWVGIFYAMGIFSGPCYLVQMVENISPLQELWSWIHLDWVNGLRFLLMAENWHLLSFQETIIENLLSINNDTNNFWLWEFYRGCDGVLLKSTFIRTSCKECGSSIVSSCSTFGVSPCFHTARPQLFSGFSQLVTECGHFCPTWDTSNG